MEYFISSAIGYLFGSFPSAYLLLKKSKGIDITKEGSGNVGAMNSYDVSNSKLLGLVVLILDLLKGLLSVYIPTLFFPSEFIYPALSLLLAVFSHCFNPWIGFKGGRGLATAAGGALLIFPFLLVAWTVLWAIFYVMRKNILFANISATVLSVLLLFGTFEIAIKYAFPNPKSVETVLLLSTSVLIVIFIKHIEPLHELISEFKTNRKKKI